MPDHIKLTGVINKLLHLTSEVQLIQTQNSYL